MKGALDGRPGQRGRLLIAKAQSTRPAVSSLVISRYIPVPRRLLLLRVCCNLSVCVMEAGAEDLPNQTPQEAIGVGGALRCRFDRRTEELR